MSNNYLKLNGSKTEIMVSSSRHHLVRKPIEHLLFDGQELHPQDFVKNLGVTLNPTFNMESHVNAICKSVHYHIRNIWKIRKYLDRKSSEAIVHALISSRIDYCNSLLYDIPNYLLQRLQRLQNTSARIITKAGKYDHITSILHELHWLPICERIKFKLLLNVYKSLHDQGPSYIKDLLCNYEPKRILRSQSRSLLCIPQTRTKTFGDRSFSVSDPKLWKK